MAQSEFDIDVRIRDSWAPASGQQPSGLQWFLEIQVVGCTVERVDRVSTAVRDAIDEYPTNEMDDTNIAVTKEWDGTWFVRSICGRVKACRYSREGAKHVVLAALAALAALEETP